MSCSYYNHQHRLTLANSTMSSQNIPLKLDGTFMGIPHGNGNANAVSGASYTAPMMFKVGGARSPPRGPLLLWPSPSAAHPEKRRMISPLRLSDCRPMRVGASPSYNTSTFCASTIFDEFVAEDERRWLRRAATGRCDVFAITRRKAEGRRDRTPPARWALLSTG